MPAAPPRAPDQVVTTVRILRAELKDGCRDRVVMGGLTGFAARQLQQPSHSAVLRAVLDRLKRYPDIDGAEREAFLGALLDQLEERATVPPSPSAPRPEPPATPRHQAPRPTPPAPILPSVGAIGSLSRLQLSPPPAGLDLDASIRAMKGVGPQRARLYTRLGLQTVRDLLFHFPTRHQAYPPASLSSDLFFQGEGSVVGVLEQVEVEALPNNLKRMKATVRDAAGVVTAVWLRHSYASLPVKKGELIALSGKLQQTGRAIIFDSPEFERGDGPPIHTRGLVPVYPLTAGLSEKELRSRIHWAVSHFADLVLDPLPAAVRECFNLLPLPDAVRAIHFPSNESARDRACERLAFDELLLIQLVVLQKRLAWQEGSAPRLERRDSMLAEVVQGFPFQVTGAQQRVIDEILADTALDRPMTRLLQGEVGSGKTAVAAVVLANAAANGFQGALMAPTEILAEQHFASLQRLLPTDNGLFGEPGHRFTVRLLTGSTRDKERKEILAAVRDGEVDVLVGTQALLQDRVEFTRLGLVIVDEQHRFGARQRVTLSQRTNQIAATTPHLLVMTATPIPRTLALSLYGDLDLSRIDEMPPGRKTVRTVLLGAEERRYAYEKVRREAAAGRQSFIICPLVEESDKLEARAATEEFERLKDGELASLRLGLLHGRMRPAEKEAVMHAFRDQQMDVLVTTAVVEVGVDIPNATVMLIEGAERFGLAQLHQFRGRVGRGEHASVCILLSDLSDPSVNERLRVMERSSSGLALAEEDLRLRGPGDYFGVRQSGFPELQVARLDDARLVESARAAANTVLSADPQLEQPENAVLRRQLEQFLLRAAAPS